MFNNLYNAAGEIRTLLMPFAFVLCVIGIGEMGWRAGSDSRAILGAVLKCIVIVTLLAGYPDIMKGGQSAFLELRNKFTNARDAKFVQLLRSTVQNQPSDAITDIGKIVPAAIGYFFQGIGRFMLLALRFFQEFAIAGLIAVSPLLIGFLFFSYTQSVGVHFGVTSLTVLLWNVAICLVDITIQLISDVLFLPVTTGGLVQSDAEHDRGSKLASVPIHHGLCRLSHGVFLSLCSVCGIRRDERPKCNKRVVASRCPWHNAGRRTGRGHRTYDGGSGRHIWRFRCRPSCY